MLARTETIVTLVENWLTQFEQALSEPDDVLLKTLFHADSHWRDVLALTWRIVTVNGADAILRELRTHNHRVQPAGFKIPAERTAPRRVTRAGTDSIEAIFTFETTEGRGSGVLRLTPDTSDGNAPKAWTFLTALDEIKGHESTSGNHARRARRIHATFAGLIGSISERLPLSTLTTIQPC
jgi:hypothetical protein